VSVGNGDVSIALVGGCCVGMEGFVNGIGGKGGCWFVGTSVAVSCGIGFIEGYVYVKVVWTSVERFKLLNLFASIVLNLLTIPFAGH
jgi:hypothetical protein